MVTNKDQSLETQLHIQTRLTLDTTLLSERVVCMAAFFVCCIAFSVASVPKTLNQTLRAGEKLVVMGPRRRAVALGDVAATAVASSSDLPAGEQIVVAKACSN